jgi:Mrp family chromosome partitioning ATPase/capsular polysaccharide biosynthesis protein
MSFRAGVSLTNSVTQSDVHVLEHLLAVLRRRWISIALFVAAGAVAGVLYGASQTPQFASSATVMVRSGFAADPVRQGIPTTTPEEEGQFLSQLELAKSASVAAMVAARLNLENVPAFADAGRAPLTRWIAAAERRVGIRTGLVDEAAAATLDRQAVIARLQAGVRTLRAGRTYVAAISYTHSSPEIARQVAQAFAEAFRQKLAETSDMANSRMRATIEAELARAAPDARPALEQKYQDMVIARALPGVDAVIISDARRPGAPIAPRKPFLVAVGAIVGAALGCLFAGLRELRDRGLRDGDLLARRIGSRFLGYLPRLAIDRRPGTVGEDRMTMPEGACLSITDPFSRFGETVRTAAVAVGAHTGPARVIAVTSALPGEGKTVFSANLAAHMGNLGRRVLLIDGDFRHPALTQWLAPGATRGIVDGLLQGRPMAELGLFDSASNVTFLPAALNGRSVEPAGLLGGDRMKAFIDEQRGQQDVILIDLPSLATAPDAGAIAALADAYVLLAAWGGPSAELVETLLRNEPALAAKLAGVIVSKADLARLPLYAASGSRAAYQKKIG